MFPAQALISWHCILLMQALSPERVAQQLKQDAALLHSQIRAEPGVGSTGLDNQGLWCQGHGSGVGADCPSAGVRQGDSSFQPADPESVFHVRQRQSSGSGSAWSVEQKACPLCECWGSVLHLSAWPQAYVHVHVSCVHFQHRFARAGLVNPYCVSTLQLDVT